MWAFKALAHLTPPADLLLPGPAGPRGAAGEIQAELEIPDRRSRTTDLLRRPGSSRERKEERFVHYSTRPDTVSDLCRLLTAAADEPHGSAPRRSGGGRLLGHEVRRRRRSGRRVLEEPLIPGANGPSVLAGVSARFPSSIRPSARKELGEHIEVLVNDAVLASSTTSSPRSGRETGSRSSPFMGGC